VRILITSASGSGTTTLATALAAHLRIAFLDADELYWVPTEPPRDPTERRALLHERLGNNSAIVVAGSVMEWDAESEDSFDVVVFLQAPADIPVARLRARELKRLGWVDEEFIAWAAQYDEGVMDGRSLARHLAWFKKRRCPIIRVSSTPPVAELLSQVSRHLPVEQDAGTAKTGHASQTLGWTP
jgi:adenylate kinase family enzyme